MIDGFTILGVGGFFCGYSIYGWARKEADGGWQIVGKTCEMNIVGEQYEDKHDQFDHFYYTDSLYHRTMS